MVIAHKTTTSHSHGGTLYYVVEVPRDEYYNCNELKRQNR